MSQAPDTVAGAGRVNFELDRFAVTRDDQWIVEGRWFGVRGRRFIRPSLTVTVKGDERRLLADLADKPWAAEDGEPWKATFPVAPDGDDIAQAELTVAPDITIALRGSPQTSTGGKPKPAEPHTQPSRARSRPGMGDRQRRQWARRLDQLQAENGQLAERLDELLDQLSHVARERDEAVAERDELRAERNSLRRERDEAAVELDGVRKAHEAAVTAARLDSDRALVDRDAATAAHYLAESERDAAIAARDRAISERDGAFALRDHAVAERGAAAAARDDAVHQRDALARTSERLQSELSDLSSARGAALVMRRAAQERSASHRSTAVGPAAVSVLALLAIVVVLIVLRVL